MPDAVGDAGGLLRDDTVGGNRKWEEATGRTGMFVFVRALTYATLFTGFLLIYVPGSLLARFGIDRPVGIGWVRNVGLVVGTLGAVIAVWCILVFVGTGKGTPAPFDPPRKLVMRGPYRFMRNPMYAGGGMAVAGAALYYGSLALLTYAAAFLLLSHVFVCDIRGTDPTADVSGGVRGLLQSSQTVVAKGVTEGRGERRAGTASLDHSVSPRPIIL